MDKIKEFFNKVKGWGLSALSALAVGLYFALFTTNSFVSGIFFGIFITRNWDIIKEAVKDFYNSK